MPAAHTNPLCKQVQRNCLHCDKTILVQRYLVERGWGQCCSRECSDRHGHRKKPVTDRFWPRVRKSDGCWLWTGTCFDKGYGAFWMNGNNRHAHIVAWELTHGEVPDGLFVLHSCDVRACCNPAHLFLGDAKANADDCTAKNRHGNPRAKLSMEKAEQVRQQYQTGNYTHQQLAQQFGVRLKAIRDVLWESTYRRFSSGDSSIIPASSIC